MNKYVCSAERGRQVKYPTFSTIVSVVLINQLLLPPLSAKIEQQLFIRTPGRAAPASASSLGTPSGSLPPNGSARCTTQKHQHPHKPLQVISNLKTCIETATQQEWQCRKWTTSNRHASLFNTSLFAILAAQGTCGLAYTQSHCA